MNRQGRETLEEHEREDAFLETIPWRELARRDFANGEEIVAEIDRLMNKSDIRMDCLNLVYQVLRRRGEMFAMGERIPVRTERVFKLRKHSGSFAAYFHSHDFYELLYVYRGQLAAYGSQDRIPTAYPQGSACLLAPGMIHGLGPSREQDVVFKIVIPPEVFECVLQACPDTAESLRGLLAKDMAQTRQGGRRLYTLMEMLAEEQLCERQPREDVIRAYLALIFAELVKAAADPVKENTILRQVEESLRQADAGISLETLARRLGYSSDYLGRCIRRESGESFTRLRQRFFMERAAERIAESDESIDDIASELGYRSTSSFYKLFEKEYGIAPGAYRKMFG